MVQEIASESIYKGNRIAGCCSAILTFLVLIVSCENPVVDKANIYREVTRIESAKALDYANSKNGAEYLYGGNGPQKFDCSGLIIWSYQQVFNETKIFKSNDTIVNDLSMGMLFSDNARLLNIDEVLPGDIVFITDEENIVTHGGIVVDIDNENITFINASSYYGKIVVEKWKLHEIVRNQWIVGFGRLLIVE